MQQVIRVAAAADNVSDSVGSFLTAKESLNLLPVPIRQEVNSGVNCRISQRQPLLRVEIEEMDTTNKNASLLEKQNNPSPKS